MISKNYDCIIPITAEVTKFMDVTMPKIKNQIVKDGFKANINSDILYYAIERPEKVQIQNFFDFKFDKKLIDFHQRLNRSFSETYEEIDKFRKVLEDSTPVVNHIPGSEYLFDLHSLRSNHTAGKDMVSKLRKSCRKLHF